MVTLPLPHLFVSWLFVYLDFLGFYLGPRVWNKLSDIRGKDVIVCLWHLFVPLFVCLVFICLFVFCFFLNSHLGPCETGHLSDIGGEAVVGVLRHAHGVRDPVDREVDHVHRISHLIWWKIHEAAKFSITNFRFLDADGPYLSVKYICIALLSKEISPSTRSKNTKIFFKRCQLRLWVRIVASLDTRKTW